MKPVIKHIAVHLPEKVVYNHEIENNVRLEDNIIPAGILEKFFGIKTRRFADKDVQVSDLAYLAGKKILEQIDCKIDLLLFAAASSDLIEPATANIVQYKLGLDCPVMDIKNACNSVVSAVHVASAFIRSGIYNNILIVNGEKLSEVINYNPKNEEHYVKCLAGYSLGDAGAAILMGHGEGSEIVYQRSISWGQYWDLCTVEGGGSRAFREMDKYYFEGKTKEMRDVFLEKGVDFINDCINESGWKKDDIDCLITHQVSTSTTNIITSSIGIPLEKCMSTFSKYGNTAAASIPLALHEAITEKKIKKGDRVMVLGLAAGINITVQLIVW